MSTHISHTQVMFLDAYLSYVITQSVSNTNQFLKRCKGCMKYAINLVTEMSFYCVTSYVAHKFVNISKGALLLVWNPVMEFHLSLRPSGYTSPDSQWPSI
jgi:hypothetical protein